MVRINIYAYTDRRLRMWTSCFPGFPAIQNFHFNDWVGSTTEVQWLLILAAAKRALSTHPGRTDLSSGGQESTESRHTETGCGSAIFDGIYGICLGNHRIIIAQKIESPTIKIIIFFFTATRSLSCCAGVGVWQNGQWLLSSSNVLPQWLQIISLI